MGFAWPRTAWRENSLPTAEFFDDFAQCGHVDMNEFQPVVQILAKGALLDGGFQVLIGSRDYPDVDQDGLSSSNTVDRSLLKRPQCFGLCRQAQFADCIKEERAAVSCFEFPVRRSTPVATPLSIRNNSLSTKLSGNAAQLSATNGRPSSRTIIMERLGHELLAGSAFALDQQSTELSRI